MAEPIGGTLGIDFTRVDDAAKHPLGMEIKATNGCEYKYIRAGAAIAAGDSLKVDTAEGVNDLDPTGAVNQSVDAISPIAIGDNKYGWVVISGVVLNAKMENGALVGARLGSSATAGSLTTLVVTGGGITAAEAERVCSAAAGRAIQCVVAPAGANVYGGARIL